MKLIRPQAGRQLIKELVTGLRRGTAIFFEFILFFKSTRLEAGSLINLY